MSTEQPQAGTAGKSDTGRSCPYCRFPLKQGDALVRCGVCAAVHHDECWHDNGGCAVVACLGGPPAGESATAAPRTATAPAGVTAEMPTATQEVPRQPPPGARYDDTNPRRQRTLVPWIVGAALLAAVVGAGAAVALALQKNGHTTTVIKAAAAAAPQVTTLGAATSTPVTSSDSQSGTTESAETFAGDTGTGTSAAGDTGTTGPEANGLLPAESRSEMATGIQQTLLSFHEDITNGDWRDAWNLMSERKQQQSLRESGYDGWVDNQKSLGNYLDPSSLQASIVSLDPASGVATVNVTGMMWSPPGRAACGWDGITWVKYEHGQWRYDPGYSTTPQRRSQWGPPRDTSSAAYSTWKQDTWPKMMGGQCVSPD